MALFGSGLTAVLELREQILRALGAEEEWLERGGGEFDFVAWMTGPAATFFHTQSASQDTPDLGVLRIVTPVAVEADGAAGCREADRLNRQATVSRWAFVKTKDKTGLALALTCSFVVGPDNLDELAAFATWCAREQIASASAALDNGIAKAVGDGTPYGWGGYSTRGLRAKPHPVTRPAPPADRTRGGSSAVLAEQARAASTALLDRMAEEGRGLWGRWTDAPVLTFEVPMSWDDYPAGLIGRGVSDEAPPTAVVAASHDDHPSAGNGLRLSMTIPWRPVQDVEVMVAEMNAMAGDTPGASHILGAWSIEDYPVRDEHGTVIRISPNYRYHLYLPAALADEENGVNLPVVMREVLLTFARMALIARRMHGPRTGLRDDDYEQVGLDAPSIPHGLAWGETGEGRNPGALALDLIYERLVGADADWADVRENGFTWWPADYRQEFALRDRLQMLTPLRENVPVTPQALTVVARLNADLGSSALILTGNGELRLAASVPVGAPGDRDFAPFALGLAADQFITARKLRAALSDLGQPAVAEHPFSGPRPTDTERFAALEEEIASLAEKTRPELTPRVALLALAGQAFLPHLITARGDGGLDFAWRFSQFSEDAVGALDGLLVRGSVLPADSPAGPGWVVRMRLPVARNAEERAVWCNKQNKVLFSSAESATLTVPGGWGLSPEGECCLSSWLPSFPDFTEHGRVANLRRVIADHIGAVRSALTRTKPGRVTSVPPTPEELAEGLTQTVATFQAVLDYPADFRCALTSGPAGVTLTMTSPAGDFPFFAGTETKSDSERTAVLIPVSGNRTELGIAYTALLGRSTSRIEAGAELDLVPGELPGWAFTGGQVGSAVSRLCDVGVLRWRPEGGGGEEEEGGAWALFSAGQWQGRVRFEALPSPRLHGAAPLLISAGVDGLTLAGADWQGRDTDVLGTWRQSGRVVSYAVIVPPAGLLWPLDITISELLTKLIRHVVRQVQSAVLREAAGDLRNAYPTSVEELFARVEDRLTRGADRRDLSAPAYGLADELASTGSRKRLVEAVRQLGGALRYSPNPRYELAAARKAFADALVPPPLGRGHRPSDWPDR